MATLTRQSIVQAGVVPSYAAAAGGGDKVLPGPGTFIHVKNGGGSSINVVLDDPTSVSPSGATQFNPDVTVAVANGAEKLIPVPERFANPADGGLASITYSGVTSVTIAALTT